MGVSGTCFFKKNGTNKMKTIFQAINTNDMELFKNALLAGEDVNATNNAHETPLIAIARKKDFNLAILELLLDQPTLQINNTDGFNDSALITGVVAQNIRFIELFLAKKAEEIDFHIQGYLCGTALTYAIFSNQNKVAVQLLNCEKTLVNAKHPTAVNWTILNENQELLAMLVARGADLNQPGFVGCNDLPDWAVREQLNDIDVPMSCSEAFTTTLYSAIEAVKIAMIELLVDTYKADINQVTPNRESALTLAARQENALQLIIYLLSRGANLTQEINGISVFSRIQQDVSTSCEVKCWLDDIMNLQKSETNFTTILSHALKNYKLGESMSSTTLAQIEEPLRKILTPLGETWKVTSSKKHGFTSSP